MKASEKRLLGFFLLLLAVVAGMLLTQRLKAWQHSLEVAEHRVSLERMETEGMLAQGDQWRGAAAWLAQNQPAAKGKTEADDELYHSVRQKAESAGLTVSNEQFQPSEDTDYYHQAGVTLSVKGELPALFRWLYSMQSPTEFGVIPSLKVKPDKEDEKKVQCDLTYWRWSQPLAAKSS
jgi:Tfp pilus assembly protein PilO